MKKSMLCLFLSILFFNVYSQDTLCTYFTGKKVYEFNYYTNEVIGFTEQSVKYYEIELTYVDVLCLDFSDDKKRYRKVKTTFFDGTYREDILESKDNVYCSPRGSVKILVGRPSILKI
tara:strand:+ start:25598 stop:25951 length:354 start_codon:yes stop_codon:yes gene_type:complete